MKKYILFLFPFLLMQCTSDSQQQKRETLQPNSTPKLEEQVSPEAPSEAQEFETKETEIVDETPRKNVDLGGENKASSSLHPSQSNVVNESAMKDLERLGVKRPNIEPELQQSSEEKVDSNREKAKIMLDSIVEAMIERNKPDRDSI